jgi:hypothetical protein
MDSDWVSDEMQTVKLKDKRLEAVGTRAVGAAPSPDGRHSGGVRRAGRDDRRLSLV